MNSPHDPRTEAALSDALVRTGIHGSHAKAILANLPEGWTLTEAQALAPSERDAIWVPTRLVRCEWPPNDGVLPGDPRFDALLASIREEGIRVPLHIHLDWRVLDGNHRLSAARLLGIDRIPVRIWTGTEWLPTPPPRLAAHDSATPA